MYSIHPTMNTIITSEMPFMFMLFRHITFSFPCQVLCVSIIILDTQRSPQPFLIGGFLYLQHLATPCVPTYRGFRS